jgi:hypothetical protein
MTDTPDVETARRWLEGQEHRHCMGEFLVKPPRKLSVLNGQNPLTSDDLKAVRDWMEKTAAIGGPADLRRVWEKWVPYDYRLRHMLRSDFDHLMQACTQRELQLRGIVSVADSVIAAQREAQRKLDTERASIAKEREKLAAREKALAEIEGRP